MTESTVQNSPPLADLEPKSDSLTRRALIFYCTFFAALTFIAHFWYCRRYGIYEDDFACVPYAATFSFAQVCSWLQMHWTHFTHGRPIGWSMWLLIPYIGFKLGNLHTVYLLASTIVMANAVLFYLLLYRAFGQSFAIIGALAYCLFPADTTRQLLVHATMLQPAVLIMLIAAHCFLSKRYVAAYILAFATLLAYEVAFLPFLCIPLLVPEWNRKTLRRLIIHGLICTAIVAAIVVIRLAFGEKRMVEASGEGSSLAYRIVTSLYIGPVTSMAQYAARAVYPFEAENESLHVLAPMILAFLAFLALLFTSPIVFQKNTSVRSQLAELHRPFFAGLAMLVAAYLLAFTPDHYPPTAIAGRMSGIHLSAALGGAILLATFAQFALIALSAMRLSVLGPVILAAYFATLVGFAFIVQKCFVLGHIAEQTYWSRVVKLCPDLRDGSLVLFEGRVPSNNWFALPNSWSDGLALMDMFDYPSDMQTRPLLLQVASDRSWTTELKWQGDALVFSHPFPPYYARPVGVPVHYVGRPATIPLTPENLIVLHYYEDGKIERVEGDINISGRIFHLKPFTRGPLPYPAGTLFPLLVDEGQLPVPMRSKLTGPFSSVK